MARVEKTVFISYRRTDVYTALAVYENLKNQGYDVFFDYTSISSGDFEQIITSNIKARAHFILILTPTALDRCNEPGDWLRREIEIAIDEKRNIVPLFFRGFRFGIPSVTEKLTGKLKNLSRYNGLNVHEDYFQEAMRRLSTQFLNIPLNTILHPVSTEVRKVVREEQLAADKALVQIEDVKELTKEAEVKLNTPKEEPDPKPVEISQEGHREEKKIEKPPVIPPRETPSPGGRGQGEGVSPRTLSDWKSIASRLNLRLIGGIAGGLLLITFAIWGVSSLLNNLPVTTPEPTRTFQAIATSTSQPAETNMTPPTQTSILSTPALGIGSTMISDKDRMTLLYVPAGEFTMGSTAEDAFAECQQFRSDCQLDRFKDEEPIHVVNLDAFWIDQTEVTNKMYALCVDAGICKEPTNISSYTHSSYYGNSEYDDYPVIHVDWNMAKAYCEWAGRRLPTEAEWEKAARGPDVNIYPWGNTFDETLANFCDTNCSFDWANKSFNDIYADVSPVGNYPSGKSIYGVLDMAGNVWEW